MRLRLKRRKTLKILGIDDWLIYARRSDSVLVWTNVETDPIWLDAPTRGESAYGSQGWRVDWQYMLQYVCKYSGKFTWSPCGVDTDGTSLAWPQADDDAFTIVSNIIHLPDEN